MIDTSTARAQILGRIRAATGRIPEPAPIPRDYRTAHTESGLADLLAAHLTDYRAHVHTAAGSEEIAGIVGRLLTGPRLVVPDGIPDDWIPAQAQVLRDDPALTNAQLDAADAVLTTCAHAVAETGTVILDAGPGQGRRALTLVPDHHICVIAPRDIHPSLPTTLPHLDPTAPQTWISGPSATSDIELDRVEGVHGPRRLDVILLGRDPQA